MPGNSFSNDTGKRKPKHFAILLAKSLNIERRYSCRAMLNFEPVAPRATGGISQINKSSLVVHMCSCTCVRMVEMNCQY